MSATDEQIKRVAEAIVAEITKLDVDGEPCIFTMDYEPLTPVTEALKVDGEICPMNLARAAIAAMQSEGIPVFRLKDPSDT